MPEKKNMRVQCVNRKNKQILAETYGSCNVYSILSSSPLLKACLSVGISSTSL
jgi:hypothetical protein